MALNASLVPHLYGDDEDVEGVGLLGGGQRLPLALQFGHLHPLPTEQRVLALRVTDCHQQHVPVAILDGLVVDSTQVVGSQEVLQVEQVNRRDYRSGKATVRH